jgi:hypothetical protein
MKELDGFSAKDLRIAERVIKLLDKNGFVPGMLFEFNEVVSAAEFKISEQTGKEKLGTGRRKEKKMAGKQGLVNGRRPRTPPPLNPGESEFCGLRCPCGGDVLIEGVCGRTISKTGIVRRGTCIECNKEFKIR